MFWIMVGLFVFFWIYRKLDVDLLRQDVKFYQGYCKSLNEQNELYGIRYKQDRDSIEDLLSEWAGALANYQKECADSRYYKFKYLQFIGNHKELENLLTVQLFMTRKSLDTLHKYINERDYKEAFKDLKEIEQRDSI